MTEGFYRGRREVLIDGLATGSREIPNPAATIFAWAPLPPAFEAMGSPAFSKLLLQEAGVAVSPSIGFGGHEEGHVRIALMENTQRIRQAARNMKAFLADGSCKTVVADKAVDKVASRAASKAASKADGARAA